MPQLLLYTNTHNRSHKPTWGLAGSSFSLHLSPSCTTAQPPPLRSSPGSAGSGPPSFQRRPTVAGGISTDASRGSLDQQAPQLFKQGSGKTGKHKTRRTEASVTLHLHAAESNAFSLTPQTGQQLPKVLHLIVGGQFYEHIACVNAAISSPAVSRGHVGASVIFYP